MKYIVDVCHQEKMKTLNYFLKRIMILHKKLLIFNPIYIYIYIKYQ